jgi:group II intron reverse transcriptase/maturase
MPLADVGKTESKLILIAQCARENPAFQFRSLAHLLDVEFLAQCFHSLQKNKAVGVDRVSWQDYAKDEAANLENLVGRLKRKSFQPLPARRVYIEKANGTLRPLGIPALENKIVEAGLVRILEAIFEADFSSQSYGFRPGRNCHGALREVDRLIMREPVNHLVEADIKGFFDTVPHEQLLTFLQIRIVDGSLLYWIEKFLKAGYVEEGKRIRTETGTPQGGILSPMLANIYLHYVLDDWFEHTVKAHTQGFCELVRYADDFVCVVQFERDAIRIEQALHQRFAKYGLELHPEKSRRIRFGRRAAEESKRNGHKPDTFDFLGFTHFGSKTRKGGFKVGRKTNRKRFAAKLQELGRWLRQMVHTRIPEWWSVLVAKLRGHYQYYGVSENTRRIRHFAQQATRLVYRWLNQRSQQRSFNWVEFTGYLTRHPLPRPRIVHNFYGASS